MTMGTYRCFLICCICISKSNNSMKIKCALIFQIYKLRHHLTTGQQYANRCAVILSSFPCNSDTHSAECLLCFPHMSNVIVINLIWTCLFVPMLKIVLWELNWAGMKRLNLPQFFRISTKVFFFFLFFQFGTDIGVKTLVKWFSTHVQQEFLKHAISDYLVKGNDFLFLRLSNKKSDNIQHNNSYLLWMPFLEL